MDKILSLLTDYSPAIVTLLACSSALVYVLKNVTEKAISTEFDRYKKEIELKLERRSKFEEKILLDRYTSVVDLQTRIGRVMTDLNRHRHGTEVENLIKDNDIVPLTAVFELLAANRYLITERFHKILLDESQIIISLANEKDADRMATHYSQYLGLQQEFHKAMNDVFGIDKITWEAR